MAVGNWRRIGLYSLRAPSDTTCTVLVVSGPKPRFVASARAQAAAARLPANVAYNFLLSGPCSLPSSPRRSVYITTTMTSLPFLLLSPFLRRFLLPRARLFALPRWRWQPHGQSFRCFGLRLPRRLASSSAVAVGGHLPSTSMTNTSPSWA